MRLGKEQAVGVIEESAGAACVPLDQPSESDADERRSVEERTGGTWRLSEVSEQGTLIRSR
jgi:hypothetical protein